MVCLRIPYIKEIPRVIIIIIIIIMMTTKVNLPSFNGNALLTTVFTVAHVGPQLP
jgi:hypothetical protein